MSRIGQSLAKYVTSNRVWRSIFRSESPVTERGQSESVFHNVWLHLHPVKMRKDALRFAHTFCLGGLSFFLFLVLVITGLPLMFYYVPSTEHAYDNMKDVDDLLTLARVDSGDVLLNMEIVDLDEIIQASCRQYEILATALGCDLVVKSSGRSIVRGDRGKLMQLVGNLLDNAIKYTPKGGQVEITLRPGGSGFFISVTDTGTGIAADDLPRIFERFYKGKSSRSKYARGSGLGLSICKWIAEAHGGRIEAKSQIGKGSTFTVWSPGPELTAEKD